MPKKRVTRKAKTTVDKENEVDFNQLSNQQQQIHCVNKVNKLGVNVKPEDLSTDEQNVFREMFDDIMEYTYNDCTGKDEINWLKDDPYTEQWLNRLADPSYKMQFYQAKQQDYWGNYFFSNDSEDFPEDVRRYIDAAERKGKTIEDGIAKWFNDHIDLLRIICSKPDFVELCKHMDKPWDQPPPWELLTPENNKISMEMSFVGTPSMNSANNSSMMRTPNQSLCNDSIDHLFIKNQTPGFTFSKTPVAEPRKSMLVTASAKRSQSKSKVPVHTDSDIEENSEENMEENDFVPELPSRFKKVSEQTTPSFDSEEQTETITPESESHENMKSVLSVKSRGSTDSVTRGFTNLVITPKNGIQVILEEEDEMEDKMVMSDSDEMLSAKEEQDENSQEENSQDNQEEKNSPGEENSPENDSQEPEIEQNSDESEESEHSDEEKITPKEDNSDDGVTRVVKQLDSSNDSEDNMCIEEEDDQTQLLRKPIKNKFHALNTELTPVGLSSPTCNSPMTKKTKFSSTPARTGQKDSFRLEKDSKDREVRRSNRLSSLMCVSRNNESKNSGNNSSEKNNSLDSVATNASRPATGTVSKLKKKFSEAGQKHEIGQNVLNGSGKPKAFSSSKKNMGTSSKIPSFGLSSQKNNPFTSKTSLASNSVNKTSSKTSLNSNSNSNSSQNHSRSQFVKPQTSTGTKPSNLCVGGTFSKVNAKSGFAKPKTKQQLQEEHREKMLSVQREKDEKERRKREKQLEEKNHQKEMKAARLKERQEAAKQRRQDQTDKDNKTRSEREAQREKERQEDQKRERLAKDKLKIQQQAAAAEAEQQRREKQQAVHNAAKLKQQKHLQKMQEIEEIEEQVEQESSEEPVDYAVEDENQITFSVASDGSPQTYDTTFDRSMLPATATNYVIDDLGSGDETDDENAPKKPIPNWAKGPELKKGLKTLIVESDRFGRFECWPIKQSTGDLNTTVVDGGGCCELNDMFSKQSSRFNNRTSSAVWRRRPVLKDLPY